ncbi:hypothetical protein FRC00_006925 [Tulasnella sp. 408]|nr:hypothetical protein FRC00_006925 [Tulasnella sp. 408]
MSEKYGFRAAMQVCAHLSVIELLNVTQQYVGGGSVRNDEEHSLANPSLVWMVNHIIDANVGILFKLSAFEGEAFRGIKPVVQSGTQRSDMIDLGCISEIDITSSEPGIKRRVPPVKKPTVMFVNSHQDAPEHSKTPLSASSRKTVFSFSLKVSGVEQQTALPARPPSPSSPMTTSSSPISPIIWTLRNEFILSVDEKTIPIPLASKDPKSGKPNSEPESPRLLRLEQVNEDNDANAVMVDQLHKEKFWWLLEFIPFWQHYQDRGAYWYKGFRMNRGRPRDISDPEPLFHSSVAKRKDYTPKARVRGAKPDYVSH